MGEPLKSRRLFTQRPLDEGDPTGIVRNFTPAALTALADEIEEKLARAPAHLNAQV